MEKLPDRIKEFGWRGKIVPITHINDLRYRIISRKEEGLIDEQLYQDQLSFFSFDLPIDLSETRSILIVALPAPQMRIIFKWQDRYIPVIVPPACFSYTLRMPVLLTTSGWSGCHNYISQVIDDLTLTRAGQNTSAKCCQGQWFL
jgi:hypothetical protein